MLNIFKKIDLNSTIAFRRSTLALVLLVVLSSFISDNAASSIFYGDVLEYNLIFFIFIAIIMYLINSTKYSASSRIRKIILNIPILVTILAPLILLSHKLSSYLDWFFISSMGALSFFAFIIILYFRKKTKGILIHKILLIVLAIISLLLFSTGEVFKYSQVINNSLTRPILTAYQTSVSDISPSLSSSIYFLQNTFLKNKMLGAGPGQYYTVWMKYRPANTLYTDLYNINQYEANSVFFKLLIETGVAALVLLVCALLKIKIIYNKVKDISKDRKDIVYDYTHIFYIATITLLLIFISNSFWLFVYYIFLLWSPIEANDKNIGKLKTKLAYFVLIMLIILLSCKYASSQIIETGLSSFNKDKDIKALFTKIDIAKNIYPSNHANQLKSRLYLQQAADMYTKADKDKRQELINGEVKNLIEKSIAEANIAVSKNKNSIEAYISRAQVYEAAMIVDINKYYALAVEDYNRAISLDPYNPDNMLALAKIEYFHGLKTETAGTIDRMLNLKPNYIPAYMTLAEILETEDKKELKAYVLQEALKSSPNNQNVAYALAHQYLKLGLIKDYNLVMDDLIKLNPNMKELKDEQEKVNLEYREQSRPAESVGTSTKEINSKKVISK